MKNLFNQQYIISRCNSFLKKFPFPRWSFDKLSRMHISFQTGGYPVFSTLCLCSLEFEKFSRKLKFFFFFLSFLDKLKKVHNKVENVYFDSRKFLLLYLLKFQKILFFAKKNFFQTAFYSNSPFPSISYIYIYTLTYVCHVTDTGLPTELNGFPIIIVLESL